MLSLSFPTKPQCINMERKREIHYTKESKDNRNLKPKNPYPPMFQNYTTSTLNQSRKIKQKTKNKKMLFATLGKEEETERMNNQT